MAAGESERKAAGVADDEARGQGSRNPGLLLAGLLGTVFATLCCIGIAPLVALVMALGLGFMLTLTTLLPLLIVSLLIGGYGLWRSRRRHGNPYPLVLHGLSGALVAVLIAFTLHDLPLIWVGLGGVLAAALWNIRLEYVYWHRTPEVDFSRTG